MANGGIFTFVSGRIPFAVSHVCHEVSPNAPCVCSNGGAIYDFSAGELLHSINLSLEVIDIVKSVDSALPTMGIELCAHDKIYFCKKNTSTEKHRKNEKVGDYTCSFDFVPEPILKVLFADESEVELQKLIELVTGHPLASKFTLVRTDKEYYEILPKGTNKGDGIRKLISMFPGIKKTIALGDNENDIPMFKAADVSVAVANATEVTKQNADYITVSNEEHAIARVISDIESGRLTL